MNDWLASSALSPTCLLVCLSCLCPSREGSVSKPHVPQLADYLLCVRDCLYDSACASRLRGFGKAKQCSSLSWQYVTLHSRHEVHGIGDGLLGYHGFLYCLHSVHESAILWGSLTPRCIPGRIYRAVHAAKISRSRSQ